MLQADKFGVIRWPGRIWVIPSIHGEAVRLSKIHRLIAERFAPSDRIVYLGNVLGRSTGCRRTLDGLLSFRRACIGSQGMFAADVAILRGMQEEMWQKLLQLHFAMDPADVLEWMLDQGVAAPLESYGGDAQEGFQAARAGATALARWTGKLRETMQATPGHAAFMAALRRAAETKPRDGEDRLLLVNAGIDVSRPLSAQNDSFWWGSSEFAALNAPYAGFRYVVRGFDQTHPGVEIGKYTASIDAGCGFGGPLLGACLAPDGELLDLIEA